MAYQCFFLLGFEAWDERVAGLSLLFEDVTLEFDAALDVDCRVQGRDFRV